eukprot:7381875-Prymnesium_polylepis.1
MAFAMLALWPVGILLLYIVLPWASRDALRTDIPTSLSRATRYLWGDYEADEAGYSCGSRSRCVPQADVDGVGSGGPRRCGAGTRDCCPVRQHQLLWPQHSFQAAAWPRQCIADDAVTSVLALILLYTCVLVIKTCEQSPEACSSYGFGHSAKGFFLFFIFFAISML